MSYGETVEIDGVTVIGETAKALKLWIEGEELWCPKSAVHDHSEVYSLKNCGPGKLVVAEWWAKEKGLL